MCAAGRGALALRFEFGAGGEEGVSVKCAAGDLLGDAVGAADGVIDGRLEGEADGELEGLAEGEAEGTGVGSAEMVGADDGFRASLPSSMQYW